MPALRVLPPAFVALSVALGCSASEGSTGETSFGGSGGSGGDGASAGASGSGAFGGAGGTGGASSGGSGGSTAGGSAGVGGGGIGGTGASCGTPNDCASAIDLGSVSGDEGGVVSHTDQGSKFLKLRVTEDNHAVLGESLELQLSLAVPAAADIDVYAYLDPETDASPCGTLPFASADVGGSGQNEQTTVAWGDGLTGSGNNDSRTVVIELKHKAGACEPWTLTALGNP